MADEAQAIPNFPDQMRAAHPEDFAAALKALGANPEYPTDTDRELAASYALRQHAGEYAQLFHQQMNRNDGTSIELPPDLRARLAAAGATDQQVREFAAQVYPNVDAATALRKLDRDIKRSRGVDVPEPTESPFFDRPC